MRIHALGTGGYHPNEVRHTASFLLPEAGILFDAGTATFRVTERLLHKDLHLFLTHPHWDHIIGLTYLYVPMLLEQIQSIKLYGNRYTLGAVKKHLFAEPTFSHMPAFELIELESFEQPEVQIDSCLVRWQPLPSHPGGSTAYVVEKQEQKFAYVTDTYVDGSYEDFIRNADLLIHECYFSDETSEWAEKTGHSYLTQVAELASRTDVKKLLLTHIDPRANSEEPWDLTDVKTVFSEIEFAKDLQSFQLWIDQ
ncbi:MBL fold metallo-hydrolase [uncultured Rubinisphaera sp.]|uniref:MBL fold metallo-hydrolase n=1 Tax=uncultured Rubinisphaera sp. TaxID=1678686 RepID=UPI0030D7D8C1